MEKLGYKSWVAYSRSHSLYIEEPRFKPGATRCMLLAHGINLLSELCRCQIACLELEELELCPGTLRLRSLHPRQSQISISVGERQWERSQSTGVEFRHLQREGHEFIPDVCALLCVQCLEHTMSGTHRPEDIFLLCPPIGFLWRFNRDDAQSLCISFPFLGSLTRKSQDLWENGPLGGKGEMLEGPTTPQFNKYEFAFSLSGLLELL